MLQSIQRLCAARIGASDGDIGQVDDCFFDDQNWAVRYLVADVSTWMPGRLVLIAPKAFGTLQPGGKALGVNLTRDQIEHSPAITLHQPISRQAEEAYHQYFGWPAYWHDGPASKRQAAVAALPTQPPGVSTLPVVVDETPRAPQLLSAKMMTGHRVVAVDAVVGHVTDVVVDDRNWAVQHIVLDTRDRLPGKKVMIAPEVIDRISHAESTVYLSVSSAAMLKTSWCT